MCRNPKNSKWLGRIVAVLSAVWAIVLISGATTDDAQRLESRLRRIEGMTQSELNQLRRNYEIFLKMPPERRAELVQLNQEIDQDTRAGGHLQTLLESYNRWFSDLSPFDRARLLNTAEPVERAVLVQKLLQEQKQRRAAQTNRLRTILARAEFGAGAQVAMKPKDLDSVVNAVRDQFLSPAAKANLPATTDDRDRHIEILKAAMTQLRQHRGTASNRTHEEANLVSAMVGAIADDDVRARITRKTSPQEVRRALGQIVARALLAEWKNEISAALPGDAQIDQIANDELKAAEPQKKEVIERNLKSPTGRRWAGIEIALATSPKLSRLRPVVGWLRRGMNVPRAVSP